MGQRGVRNSCQSCNELFGRISNSDLSTSYLHPDACPKNRLDRTYLMSLSAATETSINKINKVNIKKCSTTYLERIPVTVFIELQRFRKRKGRQD
jgi:hypothetical protein